MEKGGTAKPIYIQPLTWTLDFFSSCTKIQQV